MRNRAHEVANDASEHPMDTLFSVKILPGLVSVPAGLTEDLLRSGMQLRIDERDKHEGLHVLVDLADRIRHRALSGCANLVYCKPMQLYKKSEVTL